MEGILFKWTGYIYGYQKAYFVLDHSSLFSYASKDSCNKGDDCVESIYIPLCEIVRNTTEKLQFEIHKSDGTWVYYRAENEADRQQWLKALGTAKACMLDTTGYEGYGLIKPRHSSVSDTEIKSEEQASASASDESDICIIENEGIEKISEGVIELTVEDKSTVSNNQESSAESNNNHEAIAICAQIKEQIVTLESVLPSKDEQSYNIVNKNLIEFKEVFDSLESAISQLYNNEEETVQDESESVAVENIVVKSGLTFMSSMEINYVDVVHNALAKTNEESLENGIETGLFLTSCEDFLSFYDVFGGTLFQPLKADVAGNIAKVKNAFQTDPEKFSLIKTLLTDEKLLTKKKEDKGPFVGLLWLLRGLRMMAQFLNTLCDSNSEFYHNTPAALDISYRNTIMQYHNWALKRMFRMGMKMCPNWESFVTAMSQDGMKSVDESKVTEVVDSEILAFAGAMLKVIKSLEKLLPK